MFATNKTKRRIIGTFILIIVSVIINFLINESAWGSGFLPIVTGAFAAVWIQSIQRRIIDKKMKKLIISVAVLLMVFNFLQMLKNNMACHMAAVERYSWYGYYIVFIGVPMLCCLLSMSMKQDNLEKRFRKRYILHPLCGILIAFVLTNDLHQQVFIFPQGIELGADYYSYNWGYYLVATWIGIMFVMSILFSFKYCMVSASRRYIWMPLTAMGLGALYFAIYYSGANIRINGAEVIPITQAFCYLIGIFIETLIQSGILPSNDGYVEFFDSIGMYAGIMNNAQEMVMETDYLLQDPEAMYRFNRAEVPGGEIVWAEDITLVEGYKHELSSERDQLLNEESILKEENNLQRDQAVLEVYNKIYDRIPVEVAPQLRRISSILEKEHESEEEFRQDLKEACILNTYIKRKSNLMILANDVQLIEIEELYLAMRESLDNLRSFGIKAGCFSECQGVWDWKDLFEIYDYFQRFLEINFRALTSLMVTIGIKESNLEIRLNITGDKLLLPQDMVIKQPDVIRDEDSMTLIFTYRRYEHGYNV